MKVLGESGIRVIVDRINRIGGPILKVQVTDGVFDTITGESEIESLTGYAQLLLGRVKINGVTVNEDGTFIESNPEDYLTIALDHQDDDSMRVKIIDWSSDQMALNIYNKVTGYRRYGVLPVGYFDNQDAEVAFTWLKLLNDIASV